ncbi:Alpha-D-ribose 1-methylphosphonate 5-triphosphate synthase subunit PhnH [Methylobacterium crusticola]|uniref:Alpha-D-ribose 1-methylphosphonate 5-triphosphate synthase subunit PhnH n=1 Tax=Methylobacterium crusticola TaxID=1697972 RepID=A0ABQ4QWM4_9HYPH|nr:phosphonate C-P lyase system protein PhnH [Methylobacterium crusticola]GJD49782.1 Alpha-D-ribose 1-methylphosphonate 5-triphosphate synthase subunit PhnH [Methylobacterium crusticola]
MGAGSGSIALARGFADPVHDAQGIFRAVMEALARPGTVQPLPVALAPPAPLTPALAGIALALADPDAPLWLDAALAGDPAVAAFLRFHTGAAVVDDPAAAAFALVADPAACPDLAAFAQGTPAYPDRSTTLVLAVERVSAAGAPGPGGCALRLDGPGIRGTARLAAAPLPRDFAARLAHNRARFPQGVDLLLAGPGSVAGLPRSTRAAPADPAPPEG